MRSFSTKSLLGLAGILVAVFTIALSLFSSPPKVASAADVVKGKVLVESICIECHSQRVTGNPYQLDPVKLYGGGEKYEGPWGVVYAKNISPDVQTGLGTWTFAEIKTAITQGIGKNGNKLLVMPWEIFQGLADEDVNNIVAYLQTLPAINNRPPADVMAPPEAVEGFVKGIPPLAAVIPPALYSQPRELFHMLAGREAYATMPPAPGFTAPQGTNSVERGGYLVKNLLGCASCHAANLAGGVPPFMAPNITPDSATGIGAWTDADIAKVLKEGIRPDGRQLSPVMPSTTAFKNLPDAEIANVIAYLRSVPAVSRAAGEPNPIMGGPPPGAPGAPPPGTMPSTMPATGDQTAQAVGLASVLGVIILGSGLLLRRRRAQS